MSVDFPVPFLATSPTFCPSAIEKEILSKMKELLSKQESTINELSKKIQDKENKDNAEEENRLAFIKRIETLQKDNSDIDI